MLTVRVMVNNWIATTLLKRESLWILVQRTENLEAFHLGSGQGKVVILDEIRE